MQHRTSRGFTLLELLVVIAIIGLLATVVGLGIQKARAKARDNKRLADVQRIQKGLELYYAANNSYPSGPAGTVIGEPATSTLCGSGFFSSTCVGTAFLAFAAAPRPADGSCTEAQNAYTYTSSATSGDSTSYAMTFCLSQDIESVTAGLHVAGPGGIQ